MAPVVIVSGLTNPIGLRVRVAEQQAIVLQRDGKILAVDLATSAVSQIGAAPAAAAGFDLSADGKTAYVVGGFRGLVAIELYGGLTRTLVRRLVKPERVTRDRASGNLLVAESRAPGRLLTVALSPLHAIVSARGLRDVRGIALQEATGRVFVAEAVAGGRLVERTPTGVSNVIATGLGKPMDMAWLDAAQHKLLITDAGGKRVTLVDLKQPTAPTADVFTGIDDLWAARPGDAKHVIIGAGDTLLLGDYLSIPLDPVSVHVPAGELFTAGWVRVPVVINDPTIAFDDLEFHIKPEEFAAMVSYSRDASFDPAKPHIMLCAGWMTGNHQLSIMRRSTGTTVGKTTFEVLENWCHPTLGPSISTFGAVESGPSGGTWGGPDSGDFMVPQNVRVNSALGTRNVGVVLVDTSSARYPTGAALTAIINNIRNEMVSGVMMGGQLRSVVTYYNQASNNAFNVNLVGIAGPISLPNAWGTYFTMPTTNWVANEDVDATVIAQLTQQNTNAVTAGNPAVLDLSQMDSLIYVFRSVINTPPAPDLFVWPRASFASKTHIIGWLSVPFPMPLFRGIARIFMPDDWATRDGTRQFHETVTHELGHNLGLVDQYGQTGFSADSTSRIADFNPGSSWELMSWERDLPLPSTAHRLMLGWINPASVRLYNFGVFGAIDENITLHAASAGAPPPGRFAAAEVRIEDGKNYYFEYRPATVGRLPDAVPPEARTVLGTEAEFRTSKPADRPNVLRVEEDWDSVTDRGAFAAGDDFRDQDTTTPGFTNDFIVDVVSTTPDSARVRIRYAADLKPDPAITPWSPSANWQSPDIEVTNGRSLADAAFRNVPWEGHENTILARVTNRGSSPARGVKVQFFAKDFTFGAGNEVPLGEQTHDIPVGATVTFTAPQGWWPATLSLIFSPSIPYHQHACLVARMAPFLDPVSNIWEVTPENNEAQSNYTWVATTTRSPASREVTVINAENSLEDPAYIYFTIHQPHPLYRTYLDHRWVFLQPGERRQILVMIESLMGDQRFDRLTREFQHSDRRIMTTMRLSALGDTRATCTATVLGGASILAISGIGTEIRRFDVRDGRGDGFIARSDTGAGISGTVLISIVPRKPDERRKEVLHEVIAQGGRFVVQVGEARDAYVQAHYLGTYQYGPCDSKMVEV